MNRTEKFQKIFASRHETAEKVNLTVKRLESVQQAVDACLSHLKTIIAQLRDSPDDERKQTAQRLQDELERSYTNRIYTTLQQLRELYARFTRSRLNIGITGNAGIGKSTLLQQLTGLQNEIIPARDANNPMGGSCTGAPSIIENNIDSDEIYADIEFYEEADFFEKIIKPYYVALDGDWLPRPKDFNEFMNTPLPGLPAEFEQNAKIRNLYEALKLRQESASEYCREFGRTIRKLKDATLIRKYVAQKDLNNNPINDWIPVKMVRIFCPFKNADGQRNTDPFSVCDTPGLGDIGCKAEDTLARNVAENVDAVWMMNLVSSNSQIVKQSDCDLYTLFRDALPEWAPKEWVYGIINRYTGTTPEQIKAYLDEMQRRHIDLRKIFELDARNADEVLTAFESTLDDVVENQSSLDNKLFNMRHESANKLLDSIRQFAETELKKFLEEDGTAMMDVNVARYKFDKEVWKNLRNGLTILRKEYEKKSKTKNEVLEKCVRELSNKKEDPNFLVKDVETIADEIKSDPTNWLNKEMTRLRVALGKEISKTGTDLAFLFDNLRSEVREVFFKAGQLESILPQPTSADDTAWLAELATRMRNVQTPNMEILEDIAQGIETFAKATLSYEQLLEPRITQYGCLDVLNPNSEGKTYADIFNPDKATEENPAGNTDVEKYPGAVYTQSMLKGQIQIALEKVCKRLNESFDVDGVPCCILVEPSAALYSGIEKFYLVAFADEDSKDRWSEFFVNYKEEIWLNDKNRIPQSVIRKWNEEVARLLVATKH